MKVGVFTPAERDPHHHKVLTAFADGVRNTGAECFINPVEQFAPCDAAVVFGVRKKAVAYSKHRGTIFDTMRRDKKPVVVIDSGYVNRDTYFMVGLNGLNGRANFRNESCGPDRWEVLGVELKPYRDEGDHILVCGQIPWDASVQDFDHEKWCLDIVHKLKKITPRPIRFRPHPKIARAPLPPIEHDLERAYAVVTFSSNSGVDAAIAGIPVFALDKGSMAWPVSSHDLTYIHNPLKPLREPWAFNLAYTQWTIEEMKEGLPWRHLTR